MVTYAWGRITGYGHLCLKEDNQQWTPMSEGGEPAMVTYV